MRMLSLPILHHTHTQLMVGHAFKCTSPNGRFADGAAAIDGKQLYRIEVHGKSERGLTSL